MFSWCVSALRSLTSPYGEIVLNSLHLHVFPLFLVAESLIPVLAFAGLFLLVSPFVWSAELCGQLVSFIPVASRLNPLDP
jgi:hypothetical protein